MSSDAFDPPTHVAVRSFEVTLTVTATVFAENAGDAVQEACDFVRAGIGPDDNKRRHATRIVHGEALTKSVFIPEKKGI